MDDINDDLRSIAPSEGATLGTSLFSGDVDGPHVHFSQDAVEKWSLEVKKKMASMTAQKPETLAQVCAIAASSSSGDPSSLSFMPIDLDENGQLNSFVVLHTDENAGVIDESGPLVDDELVRSGSVLSNSANPPKEEAKIIKVLISPEDLPLLKGPKSEALIQLTLRISECRQNVFEKERVISSMGSTVDRLRKKIEKQKEQVAYIRGTIYRELQLLREQLFQRANGKLTGEVEFITSVDYISNLVNSELRERQAADGSFFVTEGDQGGEIDVKSLEEALLSKVRADFSLQKINMERRFKRDTERLNREISRMLTQAADAAKSHDAEMERLRQDFEQKNEEQMARLKAEHDTQRTLWYKRLTDIETAAKHREDELKDKIAAKGREVEQWQLKFRALMEEKDRQLTEAAAVLERSRDVASREIVGLKSQLLEMETALQITRDEAERYQEEAQEREEELTARFDSLEADYNSAKEELDSNAVLIASLESRAEAGKDNGSQLLEAQAEVQRLSAQLNEAIKKESEAQKEASEWQAMYQQAVAAHEAAMAANASLKTKSISANSPEYQKLETEFNDMKRKLVKTERELTGEKEGKEAIKKLLEAERESNGKLKETVEQMQVEKQTVVAESERNLEEVKTRAQAAEEKNVELSTKLEETMKLSAEKEETLKVEMEKMEQVTKEVNQKFESLQVRMNQVIVEKENAVQETTMLSNAVKQLEQEKIVVQEKHQQELKVSSAAVVASAAAQAASAASGSNVIKKEASVQTLASSSSSPLESLGAGSGGPLSSIVEPVVSQQSVIQHLELFLKDPQMRAQFMQSIQTSAPHLIQRIVSSLPPSATSFMKQHIQAHQSHQSNGKNGDEYHADDDSYEPKSRSAAASASVRDRSRSPGAAAVAGNEQQSQSRRGVRFNGSASSGSRNNNNNNNRGRSLSPGDAGYDHDSEDNADDDGDYQDDEFPLPRSGSAAAGAGGGNISGYDDSEGDESGELQRGGNGSRRRPATSVTSSPFAPRGKKSSVTGKPASKNHMIIGRNIFTPGSGQQQQQQPDVSPRPWGDIPSSSSYSSPSASLPASSAFTLQYSSPSHLLQHVSGVPPTRDQMQQKYNSQQPFSASIPPPSSANLSSVVPPSRAAPSAADVSLLSSPPPPSSAAAPLYQRQSSHPPLSSSSGSPLPKAHSSFVSSTSSSTFGESGNNKATPLRTVVFPSVSSNGNAANISSVSSPSAALNSVTSLFSPMPLGSVLHQLSSSSSYVSALGGSAGPQHGTLLERSLSALTANPVPPAAAPSAPSAPSSSSVPAASPQLSINASSYANANASNQKSIPSVSSPLPSLSQSSSLNGSNKQAIDVLSPPVVPLSHHPAISSFSHVSSFSYVIQNNAASSSPGSSSSSVPIPVSQVNLNAIFSPPPPSAGVLPGNISASSAVGQTSLPPLVQSSGSNWASNGHSSSASSSAALVAAMQQQQQLSANALSSLRKVDLSTHPGSMGQTPPSSSMGSRQAVPVSLRPKTVLGSNSNVMSPLLDDKEGPGLSLWASASFRERL